MAVHILYNAQKGRGIDNLLYALYKGRGVVFASAKNCQKWPFWSYIICGRSLSSARHNNNCGLVSFNCFVEYEVYYSLESARLFFYRLRNTCLFVRPINTFRSLHSDCDACKTALNKLIE